MDKDEKIMDKFHKDMEKLVKNYEGKVDILKFGINFMVFGVVTIFRNTDSKNEAIELIKTTTKEGFKVYEKIKIIEEK